MINFCLSYFRSVYLCLLIWKSPFIKINLHMKEILDDDATYLYFYGQNNQTIKNKMSL
jgi:hypothetical protein